MKKLLRIASALLALSTLPLTLNAHSVQVAYCSSCTEFKIYVEHWHGTASVTSTTMTFNVTVNGVTTTQTLVPVANHQNIPVGQLPCSDTLVPFASCAPQANTYNDWMEFSFPNVVCGDTVQVTVVAGNTAFSADGCTMFPATTPTFSIPCDSVTTPITVSDQTVCEGDSFAAITFPTFPGITFSWTNNDTLIGLGSGGNGNIPGFPSSQVDSTRTGTVRVMYGCRDTTFDLTVLNGPTPKFGVTPFCQGETIYLWDSSYADVVSWDWDYGNNSTTDDTVQNPAYLGGSGPHIIRLTVTDSTGCSNYLVDTLTIVSQPQPTAAIQSVDTVCVNNSFSLVNISTVGSPGTITGWAWDILDNNVIDYTTQNASHTFTTPGAYTVQTIVTTGDGCQDSTSKVIHAITCTGINEFNASTISTWPNPAKEVIHITFEQATAQQATAQLLDMSGRLIQEERIYAGITNNIDVSTLASGVYLLRLVSDGQQYSQPVHISR